MPTKPLSVIALVLFIPAAVLIILAVRSLSLENDALNARRDRLIKERMISADAQLNAALQNLGSQVLSPTVDAYAQEGPEALLRGARKRLYVYAFVFKQGTPLHSASALEHQYDLARGLQEGAQALAASSKSANPVSVLVPAGTAYALLSCATGANDEVVCIAIDPSQVTHTLQAALDLLKRNAGFTQAALVAPNNMKVSPDEIAAGQASSALDGILRDWRLYSDLSNEQSQVQNTMLLYVLAGFLIAGWASMTWMLHRSSVLKEEAASARASVVAQLAHELRTPLANLKLHTELLSRKASQADAVERYSSVLQAEIDRLSNVAENAIVVARGAMNAPKLETAVPDQCLRSVLERYDPTLSAARCVVRVRAGAGKPCLFDRTAWERCVINLIDNARKYAPGTEIEISTDHSANTLRLTVSDQGPGIAAGQFEQIFEPLARGTVTKASGFGLGLAAVRALARQNGGDCRVEANGPGAHFVLTMTALAVASTDEGQC